MEVKEVNGKKYIKVYHPVEMDGRDGCDGCVANDVTVSCSDLVTADCFFEYVWARAPDLSGVSSEPQDVQDQKPGTKYDADKTQYSLVPAHALKCIADNLTAGLKKYKERDNWKKVPNAQQRYLDALYRHLEAHRRGELYDTDSSVENMPHLAAVAVNAMFLLEFMLDPNLEEVKGE
jgi:hypothetical protein